MKFKQITNLGDESGGFGTKDVVGLQQMALAIIIKWA